MGDIKQYLHDLRFAQYGSDLKSAIMNCLSQCYEESGGTGDVDLVARQSIDNFKRSVALSIRPVGSIFITTDISFDPNIRFGGTWVVWGAGRSPVGVNTSDTDFSTVEKTGGAKTVTLTTGNLPSHTHSYAKTSTPTGGTALTVSQIPSHTHTMNTGAGSGTSSRIKAGGSVLGVTRTTDTDNSANSGSTGSGNTHTHTLSSASTSTKATGSGMAVNNMQPYITCCMWKRVA